MDAKVSPGRGLANLTTIRRVKGQPGDCYEVIFLDQRDHIVVGLTAWYHIRKKWGPLSTYTTYLTHLLPFLSYLIEQGIPWNASPDRLRPALIAFYQDRLGCLIQPGKLPESVEIAPTNKTPVKDSTLRVLRSALRDFYLVMRDEKLYAFPNPLTSETLLRLKRLRNLTIVNAGAPDHAGIRGESHVQSHRQPTAFIRYPDAQEWKPDLRKELADVRDGMHTVLDALLDSPMVTLREKAVLELLQNTGARLHEIVNLTVGGYRNDGIAGEARVIDKGSHGREIKTIYFARNPKVQHALNRYIEQVRPSHDLAKRGQLVDLDDHEPLFLSQRGTPYAVKDFYYHWYRHYLPLAHKCPVRFSPHDIRHLFITEFLIVLRLKHGFGTDHFNSESYLSEREAFASQTMAWRSPQTIDIYDHSRDKEGSLGTLAMLQKSYEDRRYVFAPPMTVEPGKPPLANPGPVSQESIPQPEEIVWVHDAETLDWVKRLQQHRLN